MDLVIQYNINRPGIFPPFLTRISKGFIGRVSEYLEVENERRNGFVFREAGLKAVTSSQQTLTTTT